MRWVKQGLLLESPPKKLNWAVSHVSLPVVLPLGTGLVRLYFSSRDSEGRSQIGRADLTLGAPARVGKVADTPVISVGKLGTLDDSGVTSSCLVEHDGRGAHRVLHHGFESIENVRDIGGATDKRCVYARWSLQIDVHGLQADLPQVSSERH